MSDLAAAQANLHSIELVVARAQHPVFRQETLAQDVELIWRGRTQARKACEQWAAEIRRVRAAVDAALALHQRAVRGHWIYCERCDSEDYAEPWPCDMARALAPVADPDPHTTSDEET